MKYIYQAYWTGGSQGKWQFEYYFSSATKAIKYIKKQKYVYAKVYKIELNGEKRWIVWEG